MIKPEIYLDTTVPSTYYDQRTPDRQILTVEFWEERLPLFEPVVSDLLIAEVSNTPDPDKRERILQLVSGFKIIALDQATRDLANIYMNKEIFSAKALTDAQHVAGCAT